MRYIPDSHLIMFEKHFFSFLVYTLCLLIWYNFDLFLNSFIFLNIKIHKMKELNCAFIRAHLKAISS